MRSDYLRGVRHSSRSLSERRGNGERESQNLTLQTLRVGAGMTRLSCGNLEVSCENDEVRGENRRSELPYLRK